MERAGCEQLSICAKDFWWKVFRLLIKKEQGSLSFQHEDIDLDTAYLRYLYHSFAHVVF